MTEDQREKQTTNHCLAAVGAMHCVMFIPLKEASRPQGTIALDDSRFAIGI